MLSQEHRPTPLFELHKKAGGKMTDFAGYCLPLSYAGGGMLAEHLHTRRLASLFDVSHMGQLYISGDTAASALANLVPADVAAIPVGGSRYTVFTNDDGGVIDDCIIANDGARGFFIVVNASRKAIVTTHLRAHLPDGCGLEELQEQALLALQGPAAVTALSTCLPVAAQLRYMRALWTDWRGMACRIARCGYTGEDGFEISLPADGASDMAAEILAQDGVLLAGLGARDSLRLEAGLCLYGNELHEQVTPVEAGLTWIIPPSRRGESGYPGAAKISRQISIGAPYRLVGLVLEGKIPARHGAPLLVNDETVGEITSGLFSPTLKSPIALARIKNPPPGGELFAAVRGKRIAAKITAPPFVKNRTVREES